MDSVPSVNGSTTVNVTSNGEWTVRSDEQWVALSTEGAVGSKQVKINYDKNDSAMLRAADIVFTHDGVDHKYRLIQEAAAPTLTLENSSGVVASVEGVAKLDITCNGKWTAKSDAAWVVIAPSAASGSKEVSINYATNDSAVQRACDIVFTHDTVVKTYKLMQEAAKPIVTIDKNVQTVSGVEGIVNINVTANGKWTATETAEWFTISPITQEGNGAVVVTYTANPRTETRTDKITFTHGSATSVFTLTQSAASATISIDPTTKSVSSASGSTTVNITANGAWTASGVEPWFSLSPAAANGSSAVTITYLANPTTTERRANLIFTNGTATCTYTLIQAGDAPALSIDRSVDNVGSASGTLSLSVEANGAWTSSSTDSWIIVSPNSSNGDASVTINYTSNTLVAERVGTVTFTHQNITKTFSITQAGADPSLFLDKTSEDVSAVSGSFSLNISSNGNWTATESADWISLTPAKGTGNGAVTVNYTSNTMVQERSATITFSNNGAMQNFTLTQNGASATLLLSKTTENVGSVASSFSVDITANGAWTAAETADWLSLNPTSGTGNGTVTVTYNANAITISRNATITFTHADKTATLAVAQAAATPIVSLNKESESYGSAAGTSSLSLSANGAWTSSKTGDWFTYSPTSGSADTQVTLTYTENTSITPRSGTINFSNGTANTSFDISQAGANPLLSIDKGSEVVRANAGTSTVNVTSNAQWSVSESADWVTISPSAGNGDGSVTINYTANLSTQQRSATIAFSHGEITQNFVLTQEGAEPILVLNKNAENVGTAAATFSVGITANGEWTAIETSDWLSLSNSSGTGNGTLTVTYAKNISTTERSATISFAHANKTATLTVRQAAAMPIVTLNKQSEDVASAAGATSLNLIANDAWTSTKTGDWFSYSPTTGNGDTQISITYTENTTTTERSGALKFTNGSATVSYVITQAGAAPSLTLGKSGKVVSSLAGSTSVNVSANGSWTVSENADWVTLSPSNGTGDGAVAITYTSNAISQQRSASITFTHENITQNFNLTQEAAEATLSLSQTTNNAGAEASSFSVDITANGAWTAAETSDWLSLNPTSGTGDGTVTVTYNANAITSVRNATITFTHADKTATLIVAQSGAAPEISLNKQSENYDSNAGTSVVKLTANGAWTSTKTGNWFSYSPISGDGDTQVNITYTENKSIEPRSGTINFTNGTANESITLTQSGSAPYMTIARDNDEVGAASGAVSVSVLSNVEWAVDNTTSWLSVSPAAGDGDGNVQISYTANTEAIARSASLTFSAGEINTTYTLSQAAADARISIDKSLMNFPSTGGNNTVALTTNSAAWSTANKPEWVSLSPSSGTKNANVAVTAAANTDAVERRATISFVSGAATAGLEVVQNPAAVSLSIDKSAESVAAQGDTFQLAVTTNKAAWYVDNNPDWVSFTPNNAFESETVSVICDENRNLSARSANIYIKTVDGNKSALLQISQAGQYILELDKEALKFTATASQQEITVDANYAWYTSKNQSWVSISPASKYLGGVATVSVQENNTNVPRSATIEFYTNKGAANEIVRTVEVTQYNKPQLSVVDSLKAPHRVSTYDVNVSSNADWTVSSNQAWCSVSPDNGVNNGKITISLARNETNANRRAVITIVAGNDDMGYETKNIIITQVREGDFSIDDWETGGEDNGGAVN